MNTFKVIKAMIEKIKDQVSLLDYLRRQGYEPKKAGRNFMMKCPFHEDKNPSCQVDNERWHCHAGCGGGDIIDFKVKADNITKKEAISKLAEELNVTPKEKPSMSGNAQGQGLKQDLSVLSYTEEPPQAPPGGYRFDYINEKGELVYCVFRSKDKKIRPAVKENGRWVKKGPEGARILYGLHKFSEYSPSKTVIIVEGEKAADYGQKLLPNNPVISWMGGTNAVSKTDWSPLNGRKCVIIPDADTPGHKAAEEVKEIIENEGGQARKIDPPPDQEGTGWDIADLEQSDLSFEEQKKLLKKFLQNSINYAKNRDQFPLHVFPEKLQKFLDELDQQEGLNRQFAGVTAMTVISAIAGNKYKLQVKTTWITPAIVWSAIIGRSGVKKSHPVKAVMSPVKKINKELYEQYLEQLRNYEYELEIAGKNDPKPNKPVNATIRYDEFTVEALMAGHARFPRGLLLYKDEMMGIFDALNQYKSKGSDEAVLLSAYDNDRYEAPARITRQTEPVDNVCISMIGTIQFSKVQELIDKHADKGIPQRVLYCFPDLEPQEPATGSISQDWLDWWDDIILSLHKACEYQNEDDTEILRFTKEAEQARIDHERKLVEQQRSPESGEHNNDYREKMKTYLPRLALMLAITDSIVDGRELNCIEKDHVERAEELCDYFLYMYIKIFSEKDKKEDINEILNILRGKTKEEKAKYLISRGFLQKDIAEALGVNRRTVYRIKQKHANGNE